LLEISVVEDEERTVAAELERAFLQAVGANFGYELADARAAGESDFLHQWVAAEGFAQTGRVV
jgi:hypothetical protein